MNTLHTHQILQPQRMLAITGSKHTKWLTVDMKYICHPTHWTSQNILYINAINSTGRQDIV